MWQIFILSYWAFSDEWPKITLIHIINFPFNGFPLRAIGLMGGNQLAIEPCL